MVACVCVRVCVRERKRVYSSKIIPLHGIVCSGVEALLW